MRSVFLRAAAAACLSIYMMGASAGAPAELTLGSAIDRALSTHPALAGFVFERRIHEAHLAEARLSAPLEVEFTLEDMAGSGRRSGLSSAQTTLSLSRIVELGGKRAGRVAVVEAEQGRLRTEQAARQLDVVAEVARRYYVVLNGQERLRIAQEGVQIAEHAREIVQARVQAARAPQVERLRAEVNMAEAGLSLEDAEHELETARHHLAAAMGIESPEFGVAAGSLLGFPASVGFPELVRELADTPDFLRFADEARLRDARFRLAEMRQRPDVRATFGVRRYEEGDDVALVAGIVVPLNSARRAAAQVDAARAERARLDGERQTRFLVVQAELHDRYQAMEHAREEGRIVREDVIPRLQAALGQSEYAYTQGRYSYLELVSVQQELLNARRRLADVATDFHILRVEIERLTGVGLERTGETP